MSPPDASTAPARDSFLAEVGERVSAARKSAGMTRRGLAQQAAISERYLAMLEAGTGNISISLLNQVAGALALPVAALMEPPDPLLDLARRATPEQRAHALRALSSRDGHDGRIALIGLRGAGKSTLGALVARKLALPFRELNNEIASAAGISVDEVFALYGQEGYRRLEREAIDRLSEGAPIVLAAAGGVVSNPETYQALLKRFRTVWLRADPREHMARVRAQGDERPMAGNPQAMSDLRSILGSREAQYARADMVLDTSGKPVRDSLGALLEMLS